jgi:hypothetical protein
MVTVHSHQYVHQIGTRSKNSNSNEVGDVIDCLTAEGAVKWCCAFAVVSRHSSFLPLGQLSTFFGLITRHVAGGRPSSHGGFLHCVCRREQCHRG